MQNPSPQVGVENLHIAIMTTEDTEAAQATYGANQTVSKSITLNFQPQSQNSILYSDDGASDTDSANGEVRVSVNLRSLPMEIRAAILGSTLDGKGGMIHKSSDSPPYLAMSFKSKKADGNYRYVQLYKGKGVQPQENYQTKTGTTNYNTPTMDFVFIRRIFDDQDYYKADEPDFPDGATFFDNVYESNADVTPPTVTVVPLDEATGVAVGSTVAWTFSEAIQPGTVTDATFFVFEDGGTAVTGSLNYNSTTFVVTFTPTGDMSAATAHTAVCTTNVKDLAGNALAANEVTNFTTA